MQATAVMGKSRKADSAAFWTLHQHDARELESLLARHEGPTPFITATITSPPYGALKNYGADDQIGYGQTYEDYLSDTEAVFRQVHRHTTSDGSLWLIADTYVAEGDAPRPLMPVPFDLARAAEAAGFTLRDVIVWHKDRTLPWSNGTRLRNAFEYVLLLTKGPQPKYRIDRLREHSDMKEWWARFPERYSPKGKAPSNVWSIPIPMQGSWGNGELNHSCPLPIELVRRLVLLSTDPGDVVLDPFAGSGIVLGVAERLNRRALGCELVERHVDEYERIVRPEVHSATGGDSTNGHLDSDQARLLIDLRILKFARVLMQSIAKQRDVPWPAAAMAFRGPSSETGHALATPRIFFFVNGPKSARDAYARRAREAAKKRPASKFGLDPQIDVYSVKGPKLIELARGRRIYLYPNGRTTRNAGAVRHGDLLEEITGAAADSVPPILSDILVDVAPRPDASVLGSLSAN
jgi:DNA modification methylase